MIAQMGAYSFRFAHPGHVQYNKEKFLFFKTIEQMAERRAEKRNEQRKTSSKNTGVYA
jgi:hypothetical protein